MPRNYINVVQCQSIDRTTNLKQSDAAESSGTLLRLVTKRLNHKTQMVRAPAGKPLRRSPATTDTRHRPGDPGSSKEACCPQPGCTVSRSCGSSHLVSGTDLFLGAVHMHSGRDFGRLLVQCQEHVARFEIETFARLS